MTILERGSILGSLLGIVVCGAFGGIAAFAIVRLVGLDGVPGALVATMLGMIVATGAWIAVTSIARAFRRPL
jgi:hypothetical protein